ncbi:MAG: undecaprenyl-diphosphate phosphatase [Gammaproteobacteria bacterium]
MDPLHILLLGLVQGLTEFLPISSTAHLILLPVAFGWPDQGLPHDIAAHLGTLAAVVLYFRRDLIRTIRGAVRSETRSEGRLLWHMVIATIPIVFAGLLFHDAAEGVLRSPLVIAGAIIGFALLLWYADQSGPRQRGQDAIRWQDALLIGLAQCLAIIPGTSRSGITMTAGLLLGFDRTCASRFSFLLSIPAILLAGVYELYFLGPAALADAWRSFAVVALISGTTAWGAIHYFLKFIERTGMTPYVIYRLVLGLVLLWIFG